MQHKHQVGDIVEAVCTNTLGTKLWQVRITELHIPDGNFFSSQNYMYLGQTVAGPVSIMSEGMVHRNLTRKVDTSQDFDITNTHFTKAQQ